MITVVFVAGINVALTVGVLHMHSVGCDIQSMLLSVQ
jgi:hypothetical protein